MPRVEKTHGNRVVIRGVGRFERGDQADVDEETAAYLTEERGDFAVVDADVEPAAEDDDDAQGDGEDEPEEDGFDVDAWLDQDFGDRADRVLEGDVDEHLEEIDAEETSDTVRDAIGERRAELEG